MEVAEDAQKIGYQVKWIIWPTWLIVQCYFEITIGLSPKEEFTNNLKQSTTVLAYTEVFEEVRVLGSLGRTHIYWIISG